ncbi:MAG: SAVED domain-containing protein [Candidatus Omnitrophica bacterium]|nr:SAVED domain-containing protein [Candidatus Omnitrophota bacterium]
MAKEVTRRLNQKVVVELWARAAGRCQFYNCNRPLYKSPVTQEQGNISEIAHIWSFSEKGPRGWGIFASARKQLNELPNLMLLCHDCHKIIDADKKGDRYSAELLAMWKEEHERRVSIVTGIDPSKKSHVILYGANIGEEISRLQPEHAKEALFPQWFPAEERPHCLSMSWEGKDDREDYWKTEEKNLREIFNRKIRPLIEEANPCHFSIFSLATMPLMTLLGSLMTDKIPAQVYQLHREPHQTWQWLNEQEKIEYKIKVPDSFKHPPVLVISLSASISYERITAVLGEEVSIWELTIEKPHNDFLRSKEQLSEYRKTMRKLLVDIGKAHKKTTALSIFPAMPVACAVEFGRVRMPKADMPWIFYDHNRNKSCFIKALEIGGIE